MRVFAVDTATLINPFAQAAVAKQAADQEAAKSGAKASEQVYQAASKDILQGLTALNQLLESATDTVARKNNKITPVPTDESGPIEPDLDQ